MYKIVPIEPTEEMLNNALSGTEYKEDNKDLMREAYQAMLASCPDVSWVFDQHQLAEFAKLLTKQPNRVAELEADKDRLIDALAECKDDMDGWGQYASEYFQEKHDLNGCIAKYDALLAEMRGK
jgi:uncharacterized membrane protein